MKFSHLGDTCFLFHNIELTIFRPVRLLVVVETVLVTHNAMQLHYIKHAIVSLTRAVLVCVEYLHPLFLPGSVAHSTAGELDGVGEGRGTFGGGEVQPVVLTNQWKSN